MKFIDLFCGLGGFRIALEHYNAECVFSSDIDPHVQKNYEYNFNEKVHGDITAIQAQDIPAHDVICGGFPCQPFSIANSVGKTGFEHTKGTLFYDVVRIAKHHKPKFVFLENVNRLEKHDGGNTLKTMIQALDDIDYITYYKTLNSADYNTAQQRKRVYLVAIRKDIHHKTFLFPNATSNYSILRDHLICNQDQSLIISRDYDIVKNVTQRTRKVMRVGLIESRDSQGYRIYSPLGLTPTFTASGGGLAGKTGAYLINNHVRKLSTKECLNVLGYPQDYLFQSDIPKTQQYKMIGNSVAVNVLKAIYHQIKTY